MIFKPSDKQLQRHIDYYWVIEDSADLFGKQTLLEAFPGITPDMLLILDGHFKINYLGKQRIIDNHFLFGFLYDRLTVDLSKLKSFIIIKFKSRGLSSLLPFIPFSAEKIMSNSVIDANEVFGIKLEQLVEVLRKSDLHKINNELDEWFSKHYKKEKEGFITDLAHEIDGQLSLKEILSKTNYSYSTLERYFKKDTGLTPKKYQSLHRYKSAVHEICRSKNSDWHKYINKYDYFDQSHFIKEIKKYTSFTPSQLLQLPSIAAYRPI